MIGLSAILREAGFDPLDPSGNPKRIKIVRHTDKKKYDMELLRSNGWLEAYQSYQTDPVFDGCDHIITFIGENGLKSRLVGVYDVGQHSIAPNVPHVPKGAGPEGHDWDDANHHYVLTKRDGLEDLEDRLIVEWPPDAINWYKPYVDRPVVEIRAPGRQLPPFRDYLRVHVSYRELKDLMRSPEAHRDWKSGLSAVGGVYLIVDTIHGQQYVGSATGNGGIWQRWGEYARTKHCGNAMLEELCARNTHWPNAFRFSILETFSKKLVRKEAIAAETFFKEKLGSRAFGLNGN